MDGDQATGPKRRRKNGNTDTAAAGDPDQLPDVIDNKAKAATAGRGRKKKEEPQDEAMDTASDTVAAGTKRGRGRPARNAVAKEEKKNDDEDDDETEEADTESKPKGRRDTALDTVAAGTKRGRGRPARNAVTKEEKKNDDGEGDDETEEADTESKPKGRRGRKPAAAKAADEADSKDDNAATRTTRGRPKKNDDEDKGNGDKDSAGTATKGKNGGSSGKAAGRKPRGKAKKKDDADADDGDDDKPDSDGDGGSKSASSSKKEEAKIKTLTVKGKAPVDSLCPIKDTAHVFCYGDEIFDAMLNQTSLQNNNNKFYIIQLLEDDVGRSFSVWQRWGRVGYDGQNNLLRCGGDFDKAKQAFFKKFNDKTGNHWPDRDAFEKHASKYDLVLIDYSSKDADEKDKADDQDAAKKDKEPPPASKLHESLQDILNMICDIRAMENAVKEMEYDATKAPLGKLTTAQIKAGYAALKSIEECIEKKDFGSHLMDACNEFYTRIPHYFGMKTPPLIRTQEEIKQKIQLLEALSDIEIAIRTLKASDDETSKLHPVDKHYEAMKCELKPLDKKSDTFQLLNNYLTKTHGATHCMYKMELLDAFECDKDGEHTRFNDVGNRMLLWHGSRLTNWYGILSQGLRIAPPEAPVTGYMFGKGVYFADMSSKSANYCFTTRDKNVGLLVLCEVALGKTRDLTNADFNADKLPVGFSSTKGVGRTIPDEKGYVKLDDGCIVPVGDPKDVNIPGAYLQYNEYIVYNTAQIKMKYLMKVKFNY